MGDIQNRNIRRKVAKGQLNAVHTRIVQESGRGEEKILAARGLQDATADIMNIRVAKSLAKDDWVITPDERLARIKRVNTNGHGDVLVVTYLMKREASYAASVLRPAPPERIPVKYRK